MNNVVQIRNVSRSYMLGGQQVTALKGITLDIEDGVFIAIAGPSGSGKSTLLNLIGCIDTPTSGQILINGQDVSGQTPDSSPACGPAPSDSSSRPSICCRC
jgi:putative ABC transport system ATP-binding protein